MPAGDAGGKVVKMMISCGECGVEMSDTATACPRCGWVPPARQQESRQRAGDYRMVRTAILAIGIMFIVGVLLNLLNEREDELRHAGESSRSAWLSLPGVLLILVVVGGVGYGLAKVTWRKGKRLRGFEVMQKNRP